MELARPPKRKAAPRNNVDNYIDSDDDEPQVEGYNAPYTAQYNNLQPQQPSPTTSVAAAPPPPQYSYPYPPQPQAQQQQQATPQYQYTYQQQPQPQQQQQAPPQYQYTYQQAPLPQANTFYPLNDAPSQSQLYPSLSVPPVQQQQQQQPDPFVQTREQQYQQQYQQQQQPPPPSYAAVSQQGAPLNEHNVAPYVPPAADVAAKPPVYSVTGMESEINTSAAVSAEVDGPIKYNASDESLTVEEQDRQMAMLLQQEEIKIKKQEEDYDRRMNKHKRQRHTNRPLGQADVPNEGSSCIIV